MIKKRKISGIYKITNLINGKIYIGSSVWCASRWSAHKCKSSDSPVSRAIRKYGLNNFKFEVIEECPREKFVEREQYWLDFYESYKPNIGYNIAQYAQHATIGQQISDKERLRRSERGKLYCGENNPFYGRTHTDEVKKYLSEINKGKYSGEKNAMYGKTHTPEARKKISLAGIGRDNGRKKRVKQISKDTLEVIKIWDSATEASLGITGKKQSHISSVCNKHLKSAIGFFWEWA